MARSTVISTPIESRLDTARVIEYVRRRRSFTTDEVAEKFKVRRGQAAAAIAIMRIKEVVERAEPRSRNGSSHWVFTGAR